MTLALLLVGVLPCDAVISLESGDPQFHSSSPGDNSGWQYEGQFIGFLGVPIAPYFFITAAHIGGTAGNVFSLHGDSYVTIAYYDCPGSDLRIWEVNHSKAFPTHAPLSSGVADLSATAAIFGRGTLRGAAYSLAGEPKGWLRGGSDGVERWGRNVVSGSVTDPSYGELLYCDFDNPGISDECHLSVGDSGGGMFVLEDGLWRLAGIHLGVNGPFSESPSGSSSFNAALYDRGGLYENTSPGVWTLIPNGTADMPSSFYSTRISAHMAWILRVTGGSGALAPESFGDWRHWYYSPAQLANAAVSGPLADSDHDGIATLLEYAFNLDPTYNENVTMTAGTGLRGLPLVRVETGVGGDYLSAEFVRRTSAGGADVTYVPEFSDDLTTWSGAGSEAVTSINSRWERVKMTDAVPVSSSNNRFARVRVVLAD